MTIKIVEQDITTTTEPNIVIAHVCNNIGAWGAGVSGAIGRKWKMSEDLFREWAKLGKVEGLEHIFPTYEMGFIQAFPVDLSTNTHVANMCAQKGLKSSHNACPLNMSMLEKCLFKLYDYAKRNELTVHLPKIGAGLAGGDWNEIFPLIENISDSYGVITTIYLWEK